MALCNAVYIGANCTGHHASRFYKWCMRGCNSFVLQCKHLVSADGLQEIEDSIGKLYRDASQNEIIKTIFGMFMIMNHKRLQKTMLIAHAMTYALPSLKYSFNNLDVSSVK